MLIGNRLKEIRESKDLSQGDIEQRTALIRCYTSRVENGHTVPSLGTLAKYAQVPIYQLFYDGEAEPKKIKALNLGAEAMCLVSSAKSKALAESSAKLKERDKGLVRLLVAKLAQAAS
jgi:transcriptional regulator with XRE-family HTH domain